MNARELIGRTIKDILVWSRIEVGGLDQAEVFLKLDNDEIVGIPWDVEATNIETTVKKGSESLFTDLSDTPVYHVNPERRSIQEIVDARRKRASSLIGRIKSALGIPEGIPKEYRPYKTEFKENRLKYLRDQKIVDFLMFDHSECAGFLKLENGYIITETRCSPHGTGMAGLNYYESLTAFEASCGTDHRRLVQ